MLLASPAGRSELERWPQYQRGAIVTDAAGRCHVKVRGCVLRGSALQPYCVRAWQTAADAPLAAAAAGQANWPA